jgi:hypothetical protein
MRTGTPYNGNDDPVVTTSFFNIAGSQQGSTYTSSNRVLLVDKNEEPYSGKATIHLDNSDGALDAVDFLGCITAITWGYAGGTPSTDEPVWVVGQKNISLEGKVVKELTLLSAWELMELSKGINVAADADMQDPAYGLTRIWDRDTTILDIIDEIANSTGSFFEQWGLTTLTVLNDDGIIDVYEPLVQTRLNDSDSEIFRRLLQMTESVMTIRASTGPTINWIDESLPGPYYTYANDGVEHPFFINKEVDSVAPLPTKIIFVDQEPNPLKGEVANYVGSAQLASEPVGSFGVIFVDPSIGSDAEAAQRADSMLKRITAETLIGEIIVPMNCCQELYDEIEIIDSRTGNTVYGRVGGIHRIYKNYADLTVPEEQRGNYFCTIKLGGIGGGSTRIESAAGGINDIETTINDFKGRSLTNPFRDTPQYDGSVLSQHLAPILIRDPATATTSFSSGTIADITGISVALEIAVASVAKVTINCFVTPTSAPAVGDVFAVTLDLDGTPQVGIIAIAADTTGFSTVGETQSRTWLVNLPVGSHTLKARGQRLSGTANWDVLGTSNQTDMIVEVFNAKNATGAT